MGKQRHFVKNQESRKKRGRMRLHLYRFVDLRCPFLTVNERDFQDFNYSSVDSLPRFSLGGATRGPRVYVETYHITAHKSTLSQYNFRHICVQGIPKLK